MATSKKKTKKKTAKATAAKTERYVPGRAIQNAACFTEPYFPDDSADHRPSHRTLAVYTQDPATPRMDVSVAKVKVPYEPLRPGPVGSLFEIVDRDETTGLVYQPLDLDSLGPGCENGLRPTTTDPRFAQQMTYALSMLTYERFRVALGRNPQFYVAEDATSRSPGDSRRIRLRIQPHAFEEDNAYYDRDLVSLQFGYTYARGRQSGLNQTGGIVFTSLSYDIVVHEMTHALLDGLRRNLSIESNPDVGAFHEAFADLVAIFTRFQFRDLVERAIEDAQGKVTSRILTDIAEQFGQSGGGSTALRQAVLVGGDLDDPVPKKFLYDRKLEEHDLGAILVAAIFDAFRWVFERKTKDLKRLAEHDRRRTPSTGFVKLLAVEASRLAGQFLNVIIRAVDYCPPVDLTFGEYLRAMITADHDIVPDDHWGYREALVRAFRRYGIEVANVPDLTEDALLWKRPERRLPRIPQLAFDKLQHRRDPGCQPEPEEIVRRADALGEFVTRDDHAYYFGLAPPRRGRTPVEPPVIESIRTLRRIGPDDDLKFDLVAEVVQKRRMRGGKWVYGGSTIIVGADGAVRYAVCKQVNSRRRSAAVR